MPGSQIVGVYDEVDLASQKVSCITFQKEILSLATMSCRVEMLKCEIWNMIIVLLNTSC